MTGRDSSLATILEREHRDIDDGIERFVAEPSSGAAAEALAAAIAALRRHIYIEEEGVFPLLAAGALVPPVLVMLREHAQIWETLDALERELAAGSGRARPSRIGRQLLIALQHHNGKEERILYPDVARTVAAEPAAPLAAFLESGSLPEGWVCIRARS